MTIATLTKTTKNITDLEAIRDIFNHDLGLHTKADIIAMFSENEAFTDYSKQFASLAVEYAFMNLPFGATDFTYNSMFNLEVAILGLKDSL